jgi:hypothetical protein
MAAFAVGFLGLACKQQRTMSHHSSWLNQSNSLFTAAATFASFARWGMVI